uniref:Uncharacterized protein n=1 Tax=Rhizophora mucronata TaxID=61149 RepID=A0A2P2QG40_RHIMU
MNKTIFINSSNFNSIKQHYPF